MIVPGGSFGQHGGFFLVRSNFRISTSPVSIIQSARPVKRRQFKRRDR